jgi:hypothetical protein
LVVDELCIAKMSRYRYREPRTVDGLKIQIAIRESFPGCGHRHGDSSLATGGLRVNPIAIRNWQIETMYTGDIMMQFAALLTSLQSSPHFFSIATNR